MSNLPARRSNLPARKEDQGVTVRKLQTPEELLRQPKDKPPRPEGQYASHFWRFTGKMAAIGASSAGQMLTGPGAKHGIMARYVPNSENAADLFVHSRTNTTAQIDRLLPDLIAAANKGMENDGWNIRLS